MMHDEERTNHLVYQISCSHVGSGPDDSQALVGRSISVSWTQDLYQNFHTDWVVAIILMFSGVQV